MLCGDHAGHSEDVAVPAIRIPSAHLPSSACMWPRGPMDKASAYGAGDCRFESCRGQCCSCACPLRHALSHTMHAWRHLSPCRHHPSAHPTRTRACSTRTGMQLGHAWWCASPSRAHGVVASHPLRMRKALGSNPSVSMHGGASIVGQPATRHAQGGDGRARACLLRHTIT